MYLGKNSSRQKRELIDGLSSLLKYLIGTPDAKDAKHYDECIDLLEKQELDLSKLMQKQIQIISSTTKNFNGTIHKIVYDEQIINENILKLNQYLNSSEKLIFDMKVSEQISTISIQILESVTSLENEINEVLTSILFAKSNIIHPSIISLKELYQELLLSNYARSNKNLIIPVTIHNIHTILDSSTLSAYVYSDRLIYILDFPLVNNEPFTLYHIFSIPIQHHNSSLYTTILPEHKYLATNPNGQEYISTSSLKNCKKYTTGRSICTDFVVYESATRPICEQQILFSVSKSIPKTCTVSTFAAIINTFQALDNNRWLYIITNETQSVLQCNSNVTHHKLQGIGILTLKEDCKLHTGFSTLSASKRIDKNFTYPITVPDIRTEDCFEETKLMPTADLHPIPINELPLDSLNTLKHQLDKHKEEITKFQNKTFSQHHQVGLSWITIMSGIAMFLTLLYLIKKYCFRRPFQLCNQHENQRDGCVQIFNNCFDSSSRRRTTNFTTAIPLTTVGTSCISEDEDDSPTQRSGASNAQSLF